jgi:hypothetical protein
MRLRWWSKRRERKQRRAGSTLCRDCDGYGAAWMLVEYEQERYVPVSYPDGTVLTMPEIAVVEREELVHCYLCDGTGYEPAKQRGPRAAAKRAVKRAARRTFRWFLGVISGGRLS